MTFNTKNILVLILIIIMSFFVNVMYYLSWMMMDNLFIQEPKEGERDPPQEEEN